MVLNDVQKLTFYATSEHPCSYLPDRNAKTIFVDPHAELNGDLYSELSDFGFRRSGRHVYRPHCNGCKACIPIRLPVEECQLTRSQKRCIKKNRDLYIRQVGAIDTPEHYALYERYINERHKDGDMYPPSRDQYLDFLTSEWGITRFFEFRDQHNKLIAVSVTDELERGISAIYCFFDPDEAKRSMGMFNILSLLEYAQSHGLSYVYLGYWIKNCRKMSYKTQFQPFQVMINDAWITVKDAAKS